MANKFRGTDGTWAYKNVTVLPRTQADEIGLASELTQGDMTIEEAARIIMQTGSDIRGFWDEKANRDCKAGRPMVDIDPALYPSSKGPRA